MTLLITGGASGIGAATARLAASTMSVLSGQMAQKSSQNDAWMM